MTVTEQVAYLKGLAEGLEIDTTEKQGKLLMGMLNTLENLAGVVVELQQQNADLLAELDDVYEEVAALTEDFLTEDTDEQVATEENDEEEALYQIICPTCGELIYLDEMMLKEGTITCHACGEDLELDKSSLDNEEEL